LKLCSNGKSYTDNANFAKCAQLFWIVWLWINSIIFLLLNKI
jgi:hypothetical protein